MAEYERCFRDPATIHATCEDYRPAASIDLAHDEADLGRTVDVPLLVLWGARGHLVPLFDVIRVWGERFPDVRGRSLDCGHFLAEERPEETADRAAGLPRTTPRAADQSRVATYAAQPPCSVMSVPSVSA